jgi:hypothetical protein
MVRRNGGALQMSTGDLGGLAVTVTLPEAGPPGDGDGSGILDARRAAAGRGAR